MGRAEVWQPGLFRHSGDRGEDFRKQGVTYTITCTTCQADSNTRKWLYFTTMKAGKM